MITNTLEQDRLKFLFPRKSISDPGQIASIMSKLATKKAPRQEDNENDITNSSEHQFFELFYSKNPSTHTIAKLNYLNIFYQPFGVHASLLSALSYRLNSANTFAYDLTLTEYYTSHSLRPTPTSRHYLSVREKSLRSKNLKNHDPALYKTTS